MHKYHCVVTPTDGLTAYVTDMEIPDHAELFALVMTNDVLEKISVLLDKEQAIGLAGQLKQFIGE